MEKFGTNRSSFVVGPQVVREDADGLPACWKNFSLVTKGNFEPSVDDPVSPSELSCAKVTQSSAELQLECNSPMKLDAMVLDMLCLSVPHYMTVASGTGDVVIFLLAVMRKTSKFVTDFERFGWDILKTLAMESYDNEWFSLQEVLDQFQSAEADKLTVEQLTFRLVCSRHVALLIFTSLNVVKGKISACGDLYNFCLKNLLCQCSRACALLDSGAAESANCDLLTSAGQLEFLLDFADEMARGCVSTIRLFLSSPHVKDENLEESLIRAVDMIRELQDGGYLKIVHSISIGLDLLSQVNYNPYAKESSRYKRLF